MEGDNKTLNLLDIIQNKKVCLRCINNSCTINKPHGFVLPEKERKRMSIFVVNPTYIKKFGKLIEISHLDFNGKKPFYKICNFIDKKCKNCSEGRIKYVNYEDKQVILCYPCLDNIKDKVTVGVHIDIKLILKGDEKYDVSFIPLDAETHLQNHICTNNNINLNNIDLKNDNRSLDDYYHKKNNYINSDNNFPSLSPNIKTKEGFVKDYSKIKKIVELEECEIIEKEEILDNNFPSLSPNFKNKEDSVKDFSKIKETVKLDNNKSINEYTDNLIIEKNKLIIEKENLIVEKNNLIIQNENNSLKNELNFTNNYIKELQNEIFDLKSELKKNKEQLDREIFKNKYKNIKDEIEDNKKEINTRVTEEFLNIEYSDYQIFI